MEHGLYGGSDAVKDSVFTVKLREFANEALKLEQSDVPTMSHWCNSVVEWSDPGDIHSLVSLDGTASMYELVSLDRMASTFGFTYTNGYIRGPHDDSGGYKRND
jgi:hypothetical protein